MLKSKVGLALGGGAARGWALVGVLEALEELKVQVDCIAGTSIGAIVGGLYALDPDARKLKAAITGLLHDGSLERVGLEVFGPPKDTTWEQFKSKVRSRLLVGKAFFAESMVKPEPTQKLIARLFGTRTLGETRIPFGAVTVDLLTGEDFLLSARTVGADALLSAAVFASGSIPGVFPPVHWSDRLLVDGGITTNIPVQAAYELGADVVIAASLGRELTAPDELRTGAQVMWRSDQIARHRLRSDALVGSDVVISPDLGRFHWTDFNRLDECLEAGRKATLAEARRIRRVLSRRYHVRKHSSELLSRLLLRP